MPSAPEPSVTGRTVSGVDDAHEWRLVRGHAAHEVGPAGGDPERDRAAVGVAGEVHRPRSRRSTISMRSFSWTRRVPRPSAEESPARLPTNDGRTTRNKRALLSRRRAAEPAEFRRAGRHFGRLHVSADGCCLPRYPAAVVSVAISVVADASLVASVVAGMSWPAWVVSDMSVAVAAPVLVVPSRAMRPHASAGPCRRSPGSSRRGRPPARCRRFRSGRGCWPGCRHRRAGSRPVLRGRSPRAAGSSRMPNRTHRRR